MKRPKKVSRNEFIRTTMPKAQPHNWRYAKVAVQCSSDSFVVNQNLVLRINICGKNRHLRQAPDRWWQP
jgi:hypothetical protein